MRTLVIKDQDIPQDEYDKLIEKIRTFYAERFPTQKSLLDYYTEEKNFSDLEFSEYHTGLGIDKTRIKSDLKTISKRDGSKYDNIVYLVHENNWKPEGIWGWNIAYAYYGYEVQQVRWDKDKLANTFGTLNHEHWHSFDSYPYRKLGVKVEDELGLNDWDEDVVHGKGDNFSYMRHKENTHIMGDLEHILHKSWTLGRLQYEIEKNPTNTKLVNVVIDITNTFKLKYQKTKEAMRNQIYGMTHKDVQIKRSEIKS